LGGEHPQAIFCCGKSGAQAPDPDVKKYCESLACDAMKMVRCPRGKAWEMHGKMMKIMGEIWGKSWGKSWGTSLEKR